MTLDPIIAEVIYLHDEYIRRFGGDFGIRDLEALQSALARPQSGYYDDLIAEAAATLESLSQNHPFIDGNKRTAIGATAMFLRVNGYKLEFDDLEAYNFMMELYETNRFRYDELEPWLRAHAKLEDSE
jgi:death-on-curing protein